jgi:hypothetical protein
MLSRKSKAKAGITTARAIIEDPTIRSAAADVAQPVARLSLGITKRVARRRARRRIDRLDAVVHHLAETISATTELVQTYGPSVVESLGSLGLVEVRQPTQRRSTTPKLVGGALIGAGAMFLLEPVHGREHRRQLQRLVAH